MFVSRDHYVFFPFFIRQGMRVIKHRLRPFNTQFPLHHLIPQRYYNDDTPVLFRILSAYGAFSLTKQNAGDPLRIRLTFI